MTLPDARPGRATRLDSVDGLAAPMPAIDLERLNRVAALQTRVDRKYLVTADVAEALLAAPRERLAVLEIEGDRSFRYESVYFDTPELALYTAAARKRRPRFKVRTRRYEGTGTSVLEVKTKSGRGETVKVRAELHRGDLRSLDHSDRQFIEATAGPGASERLVPRLTTRYLRTTFADLAADARLTIDRGVQFVDWLDRQATLDGVVIESKSAGRPAPADRWLWSQGIRPVKFSKYCVGLAVLHGELPANRWHRVIGTWFGSRR